ncbi:MAG: hypothetical protein B0D96_08300 [Candidatus Sedimenticola endophacoides]|uniref:Uncharacterized protein n=1 Tax=Candidatus Sedimenticola endophacoides TaxID=2548426 RepID=A0A657Q3D2_9GAMM|nr:MAG: hypothetical protein B0D94_08080 [Candidatus Sedimenticola endophacoides]OQX34869.1 MAG: hypothetical protein B0D96_08300 [Candidatus Sedimenticola endophacoides]OQX36917.1 MAG: hypothetical protein B0D84_01065 [Candidatus Sedimenticola endophacoides]OQX40253.1 MAG: hypothetical protein B0D89_08445 [Candidatus Sedimenticola endophacoides]OQX43979.1 MAG: hypothetical protein B0D88_03415 [Candidatus Sedimenticola endophacoides]
MQQETKRVKKRPGKKVHSMVTVHASEKAAEIRARFGPEIDYATVVQLLGDRRYTRYPVEIRFVSEGIEPGMFALTEPASENPDDGYVMNIHPFFEDRPDALPALILYQTVLVNYGDIATANDAEIFGAGVLGMERDDYYDLIVRLTDSLWS